MAILRSLFIFALLACAYAGFAIADDDTTSSGSPTTTSSVPPTTTSDPNTDRSFSIESSNAPNTQFEWDAVQCLSEAYLLHPDSLDTVTETYGKLYQLKHAGVWRVNAGCASLYIPQVNVSIVVKVSEGTKETPITLYN